MLSDLTSLDSPGWSAVRDALNQRVVLVNERLIPSKVNRVWVVETDVRPVIVKRSLSGKGEMEFEALGRARGLGLNVPFPLHRSGDYLVLEYIGGERCDSLVKQMFSTDVADAVALWLSRFHEKMASDGGSPLIMTDAELSNFVWLDGAVYGLDLEDVAEGDPLEDLGRLVASIIASEPMFAPIKFDVCLRMLRTYEAESGMEALESVRPFVAKHLRLSGRARPVFRRTLVDAAASLESSGWPNLA